MKIPNCFFPLLLPIALLVAGCDSMAEPSDEGLAPRAAFAPIASCLDDMTDEESDPMCAVVCELLSEAGEEAGETATMACYFASPEGPLGSVGEPETSSCIEDGLIERIHYFEVDETVLQGQNIWTCSGDGWLLPPAS